MYCWYISEPKNNFEIINDWTKWWFGISGKFKLGIVDVMSRLIKKQILSYQIKILDSEGNVSIQNERKF